jgi:predicted nucleic acid-binding protein
LIYLDASVVLAELLTETRRPPAAFWDANLVSSRLLEYEVYTVVHGRGLAAAHDDVARHIFERTSILEMIPEILDRARAPFPVALRTLDALHLASVEFLREQRQEVQLASYDQRLITAAKRLKIDVVPLP